MPPAGAKPKPYRKSLWRRAVNALVRPLARLGLTGPRTYLLTVPGRKSGRSWSTPVSIVRDGGERWLVAPYGERNWVKNARAAGWVELRRGRRRERLSVAELEPADAVPVLRRYYELGRVTRPFFDVDLASGEDEWIAEAPRHPVFRLDPSPHARRAAARSILVVAATERELGGHAGLVCGVGPVEAAAATARSLALDPPDAVLHVGLAGGRGLDPGTLVVASESVYEDLAAAIPVVARAAPDPALAAAVRRALPEALELPIGTSAAVGGLRGSQPRPVWPPAAWLEGGSGSEPQADPAPGARSAAARGSEPQADRDAAARSRGEGGSEPRGSTLSPPGESAAFPPGGTAPPAEPASASASSAGGAAAVAAVEAMEGFAVLRACELAGVPAVEVRAISNEIDEEDRGRWEVERALERLHAALPRLLAALRE